MTSALADLGLTIPLLAAPMAGGPSTTELVRAVASVGGIGFLAAGYKTPQALAEQIATTRADGVSFGVNVFVPTPVPVSRPDFERYARRIQVEADVYGIDLSTARPQEDDDHWTDKVQLLLDDPVPMVSFTFGIPGRDVIAALRRAGTLVVQTVTSAPEALMAAEAGADLLAVQGSEAGGHWGTFTPLHVPRPVSLVDLIAEVRSVVTTPLLGAGGISTAEAVATTIRTGVLAVAVGTALLRTDESGASDPYKRALSQAKGTATLVTRAFSGRPARAVPNGFTDRNSAGAPSGYPAIHHLTTPLRRAAAAAGDAERINLWAGTGYGDAVAGPVADAMAGLARRL